MSALTDAAAPRAGATEMVTVRAVHKVFGHGQDAVHVLKGVDLDVARGERKPPPVERLDSRLTTKLPTN